MLEGRLDSEAYSPLPVYFQSDCFSPFLRKLLILESSKVLFLFRGIERILFQIWGNCRSYGNEGSYNSSVKVSNEVNLFSANLENFLLNTYIHIIIVSICRGFGFVTFADVTGVDKVLAENSHDLDGKKVGVFHSQQLFHANHHERVHSVF